MFNERLLRSYYDSKLKENLCISNILLFNSTKIPIDAPQRLDTIKMYLNTMNEKAKIETEIKENKLSGFIEYWSYLGFFDFDVKTNISFEELLKLTENWLNTSEALLYLSYLLVENNEIGSKELNIEENKLKKHRELYPDYYLNEETDSLESILNNGCFMQSSISSLYFYFDSIDFKERLEINTIKTELSYLLHQIKTKIEPDKKDFFADVLYSLFAAVQKRTILRLLNLRISSDDIEPLDNALNACNSILKKLEKNEKLLKSIIISELE